MNAITLERDKVSVRDDGGKAARNAAYLSKLDRAVKQMNEGTGRTFTDEELRMLFYAHNAI